MAEHGLVEIKKRQNLIRVTQKYKLWGAMESLQNNFIFGYL